MTIPEPASTCGQSKVQEDLGRRRRREQETIVTMLRIYCRAHHGAHVNVCADCEALQCYALRRLACCVFGENKPTCANCAVHCYSEAMQARILEVMRYAGPRMLMRHPWLAVMHLVDGWRRIPALHEVVTANKKR